MLIRKPSDIPSSQITSNSDYMNRRKFMAGAAALGLGALGADILKNIASPRQAVHATTKLTTVASKYSTSGLTPTSFEDITTYNNFYEFGTEKEDPSNNAQKFKMDPGIAGRYKVTDISRATLPKDFERNARIHQCFELEKTS